MNLRITSLQSDEKIQVQITTPPPGGGGAQSMQSTLCSGESNFDPVELRFGSPGICIAISSCRWNLASLSPFSGCVRFTRRKITRVKSRPSPTIFDYQPLVRRKINTDIYST